MSKESFLNNRVKEYRRRGIEREREREERLKIKGEYCKRYILQQFYEYNIGNRSWWRNHSKRARFVVGICDKEENFRSIHIIILNEISLMENGKSILTPDNELIQRVNVAYLNSRFSKTMKNRSHIALENSEYRRVLERCANKILDYNSYDSSKEKTSQAHFIGKENTLQNSKNAFPSAICSSTNFKTKYYAQARYDPQNEINENFLIKIIHEIKKDFKKVFKNNNSNAYPEYTVLLATKILFKEHYNRVLNHFKKNNRFLEDDNLELIHSRQVAKYIGENPADVDFYTQESLKICDVPQLEERVLSRLSRVDKHKYSKEIEEQKAKISKQNIEKLDILPKNNLYIARSGETFSGHYFCIYVSSSNIFIIDVMSHKSLSCKPLDKINDDFAEKFGVTGICLMRIDKYNFGDIVFFIDRITGKTLEFTYKQSFEDFDKKFGQKDREMKRRRDKLNKIRRDKKMKRLNKIRQQIREFDLKL